MRTIKFKAKRKCKEQWVSGDLAHSLDGKLNILGFVEEEGKIGFTGAHPIDPITVCQFTGFHDKNGKEVYDGDVLRSDEYPYSQIEYDERDYYFAVIYYCTGDASFLVRKIKNPETSIGGFSHDYPFPDNVTQEEMADFEVIGSIHDFKWRQYRKYFQIKEETEETND